MRKLILIAAISSIFFGCSDNSSAPQICELKKLYYSDVMHEPYTEYQTMWLEKSCQQRIGNDCTYYDRDVYITIEECGNIYIKD